MACRGTGMAMPSGSPQEVMDLAPGGPSVRHPGQHGRDPFLDGFRTSHEIQKLRTWTEGGPERHGGLGCHPPVPRPGQPPQPPLSPGSNESPETFFQHREASNTAYNRLVETVVENMEKVNQRIGTNYKPFNYYGAPDATDVVGGHGPVCGTLEEVVDVLPGPGEKSGGSGGSPLPALLLPPPAGGAAGHPPAPGWCWTAPRSPAPSANPLPGCDGRPERGGLP